MKTLDELFNSYFIPIWLSVSVWMIVSTTNTLLGDSIYYYKLVTTIITIVMMSFWVVVLIKFLQYRKRQNLKTFLNEGNIE